MLRNTSLEQKNSRVWLRGLAAILGRPATFAEIPDEFIDQAASQGFDCVWFPGL